MAKSLGLSQLVKSSTRTALRNNTLLETKIDLIFSNSDYIIESRTLDYNISDHLAVLVNRKKNATMKEKTEPNELWDFMEAEILRQANEMCPITICRVKARREPWLTNEAIEAIRDKDRLMRKAKRSKKADNWEVARRARNRVGRDLENLRADFLKQQQEENKSNQKKFWSNISAIFPSKKGNTSKVWLKDPKTGNDVEPKETANYINEFFTNIGPELAKQHNTGWKYFGVTVCYVCSLSPVRRPCVAVFTARL